jgi:hypothetical protein
MTSSSSSSVAEVGGRKRQPDKIDATEHTSNSKRHKSSVDQNQTEINCTNTRHSRSIRRSIRLETPGGKDGSGDQNQSKVSTAGKNQNNQVGFDAISEDSDSDSAYEPNPVNEVDEDDEALGEDDEALGEDDEASGEDAK